MQFILTGPFVPAVRMTTRGKWKSPAAQRYIASQSVLAWQYKAQMQEHDYQPLPRTPTTVRITIVMRNRLHRQDLDNQVKALLDAAQGIVFDNDLWIDTIHAQRRLGDADEVRIHFHPRAS